MDDDFFSAFEDTPQKPRQSDRELPSDNSAQDLVASILGTGEVVPPETDEQPILKKRKKDSCIDVPPVETNSDDLDALKLVESAPKITIHTLQTADSCTHEVAVPPGQEFLGLKANCPDPARTFPFELDAFQKQAILCIENYQSILVSAHTSAGKTVPAEYAIALSLREKQRVIYTTPIKALSNQKFREFEEKFKDVGIITGDVTLNPGASCLIMTTEILRSMLYRGSEITREVGWVIFDEIHYMRDKERGVVWEESLILLPDNVHFVFLSATIPNARQFAEWIAHLHKQPCHVVYTDYRPTPLTHYIFPAGGNGVHLVVDGDGNFREDNFSDAMAVIANNGEERKSGTGNQKRGKDPRRSGAGGAGGESDCFRLVKLIMENDWAPAIVFSFSKKECEAYALQMSKLDFNTPVEKQLVDTVYRNAIDKLSPEDRCLPQVENVLPLLKRGIGIHHGGLLPILKELVEILFAESLIKVLFATETFAMGLNMPARTVLFTSARKFDGTDTRWISSGEYIQMSGRAGRRGLDASGIVILMLDEKTVPSMLRNIVKGSADPINSAFRLTYNMVLNLLRVEEVNPEYIMERSFVQFQNYSNIPKLYKDVKDLEVEVSKISIPDEAEVESYFRLREQLSHMAEEFRSWLIKPQYLTPFLQPGRLVRVKQQDKDFGFGVIINFKKKAVKERDNPMETAGLIIIDVMLFVSLETAKSQSPLALVPGDMKVPSSGVMEIVPIDSGLIHQISSVKLYIPSDLRSPDNKKAVFKSLQQVYKRFSDKVPLLDPVKDMKIEDKSFKKVVQKISTFETRLEEHAVNSKPDLLDVLETFRRKDSLTKELENAKSRLNKAKSLIQMADLNKMKRVLRRLKYCTETDVIEVKGRIACELSSADELLLTEMIFNGLFNSLSAEQCASILSCFVSDEKSNEMPKLTEELSGPLRTMQEMARKIAQTSMEAKIDLNVDDYVSKFKPFMMDVVFEWCKGQPFVNICKMTDLFEGSIIRSLRRLEELLRQMVQASKNIGNAELENKFSDAIKLLKRDIVFAASLYL